MEWNWQQEDWPNFKFDALALENLEADFQKNSGYLQGTIRHIAEDDKNRLTIELISEEALRTSEIEGERLSRDSIQSSIRRNFGLATDNTRVPPAEQGIAELITDVYQHFSDTLTHETLFKWHGMLMSGNSKIKEIGKYRTDPEPMQVVSGPLQKPIIHFEAPPSDKMPKEMSAFISWFNETAPGSSNALPALTRAGIAHLYFVCIHPFEDGNGRIGRAIAEKALAQSLGQPTLIALSRTIQAHKKDYYNALEWNNKNSQISSWLLYFGETILKAQTYTQELVDFIIKKSKFYERITGSLNERQSKALARMLRDGPGSFTEGLTAQKYINLTSTSRATATRDLQELVDMGVLHKTGKLKNTRYRLNLE
ncbi:Fic family protein [Arcicella lustrica]|uniref:Fic family protein n=1 Tax=Arcicella lustrica TaxID=2984196 RepID=A0ABU5SGI5_9BACT|nr:Fic family protein [Arcicella sp. DC25W]MEA5426398.1 Fic family protein [Arcicella sp. DC25W]